ncbi:hypothetical protein [Streptomyces sp. McG3]|uniref:hypothetical protein n=1 Tax=unclassified Streptomyces TaxID=2593676 RepID=UPI002036CC52|nr:hypothetical protein [Streptomyces sp. McG3]
MSLPSVLKPAPRAGRPQAQRPMRLLQITLVLQSAVILAQAATAGLLLASVPVGRELHGVMGGAVLLVVLLNLGATILAWKPGGGSPRLLLRSAPMLVFTLAQMVLGFARVRELHVPIGVLMFGASVMLLTQVRNDGRPARGGEAS